MNDVTERVDLLDGAIYADLFDCAVTFDELWRYGRVRITREALSQRLAEPVVREVIRQRGDLYCLAGREHLVELRPDRQRRAQTLTRRAVHVAGLLRHVPFVRGVLLTGSVAAESAAPDADVDLLVIVAARRIASVFVILGSLSRLLSRRVFCPNYYLSEAHLTLRRQDPYVARELAQCRPLAGRAADLWAANRWIGDYLPNAAFSTPAVTPLPTGSLLQRLLEIPLRGPRGDWLEERARKLAAGRLVAHYGAQKQAVPEDVKELLVAGVELRFHGSPVVEGIMSRYEARRAEIAAGLRKNEEQAATGSGRE